MRKGELEDQAREVLHTRAGKQRLKLSELSKCSLVPMPLWLHKEMFTICSITVKYLPPPTLLSLFYRGKLRHKRV